VAEVTNFPARLLTPLWLVNVMAGSIIRYEYAENKRIIYEFILTSHSIPVSEEDIDEAIREGDNGNGTHN
jgi:hypothetical protein